MTDPSTNSRLTALRDQQRGGTEPLVALVSVAAICVAFSVYAGFASVTIGAANGSNSDVEQATLDATWHAMTVDGLVDVEADGLATTLGPDTLPRGYQIRASITVVGDEGRLRNLDSAGFDAEARPASPMEPPDDAEVAERPVAVRLDDADIRPGRLTVVVWDA